SSSPPSPSPPPSSWSSSSFFVFVAAAADRRRHHHHRRLRYVIVFFFVRSVASEDRPLRSQVAGSCRCRDFGCAAQGGKTHKGEQTEVKLQKTLLKCLHRECNSGPPVNPSVPRCNGVW
uniref:Uncharacterized protein n=1 Tax=Anopheles atroparvus TaxID=41427 RepID=A0AAG5DQB1_ANOAO